jgi:hypothetical protein
MSTASRTRFDRVTGATALLFVIRSRPGAAALGMWRVLAMDGSVRVWLGGWVGTAMVRLDVEGRGEGEATVG